MSLLGLQTLLARLLTDEVYCQSFFASPEVPADLEITQEELHHLLVMNRQRLVTYSRMLYAKRILNFSNMLPLTYNFLGRESFYHHGRQYCEAHVPTPSNENFVHSDSRAFAEWLQRMIANGEVTTPYLHDVLRMDLAKIRLNLEFAEEALAFQSAIPSAEWTPEAILSSRILAGRHFVLMHFPFDAHALLQHIQQGLTIQPPQTPSWLLFIKVPYKTEVKMIRANRATARLLELLDGQYTGFEVLERLGIPLASHRQWVDTLLRFYQIGLVKFIPAEGGTGLCVG